MPTAQQTLPPLPLPTRRQPDVPEEEIMMAHLTKLAAAIVAVPMWIKATIIFLLIVALMFFEAARAEEYDEYDHED